MPEVLQKREAWEQEYQAGSWEFLDGKAEAVRNSILAQYVHWDSGVMDVLDLGCGSAAILGHLKLENVRLYTGVDIAQAALEKVKIRRPQDVYICESLEKFEPRGKWNVIIFNEILYYLSDPVAELLRFEAALKVDGHFVISMHQKRSWTAYNNRCLRRLMRFFEKRDYRILDSVELRRFPEGTKWRILAVQPNAKYGKTKEFNNL